jgi:hypothetical protein
MQNVPKIVRERLKAAPSPVEHPDADVLTAFSEQSLPDAERTTVIDHLARCADCRDVDALAFPETDLVDATAIPVSSRWFTWPVLRWGFVAAGIVAIASLGVVQYQHQTRLAMMASKASPRSEAPETEAKNRVPASPVVVAPAVNNEFKSNASPAFAATASASRVKADAEQSKLAARADTRQAAIPDARTKVGVGGGVTGGRSYGGPLVTLQQQATVQTQSPAPAPPPVLAKQQGAAASNAPQVPAASEAVEVTGEAVQVDTQAQSQKAQLRDEAAEPQAQYDYDKSAVVGKAKPAVTTEVSAAAPAAQPAVSSTTEQQIQTAVDGLAVNGRNVAQLVAVSPAAAARWTISAAGGLQRSVDQGKTWQDVNVIANTLPSANFISLDATAAVARAKEKDADKKSLKGDSLKRESLVLTFRAVTATGADVWAGGTRGILYHSADAGNHWTRVLPSSAGTFLTGDIVSLEFPDVQHGKVTTSTSEVWTTTDVGQTWQKQ